MQTTAESKSKGFFRSSPSTAFDQYLQDIQKLPLISDAEEERRLARRAQAGDEKAAERLVTANLRFVISYVKKYQGHGLDLSELVAIGNEGLLKAVRKFDPEQGVKFISYAVWWVRQAVLKALAEQTRSVRIPLNQNSQLIRLAAHHTLRERRQMVDAVGLVGEQVHDLRHRHAGTAHPGDRARVVAFGRRLLDFGEKHRPHVVDPVRGLVRGLRESRPSLHGLSPRKTTADHRGLSRAHDTTKLREARLARQVAARWIAELRLLPLTSPGLRHVAYIRQRVLASL